jgi:hypothetical protein
MHPDIDCSMLDKVYVAAHFFLYRFIRELRMNAAGRALCQAEMPAPNLVKALDNHFLPLFIADFNR